MLDVINKLKPVTFDWKPEYIEAEGRDSYAAKFPRDLLGFIAQDVETLVPQAVQPFNTTHAPDFRTFNKAELLPAVVGAIQATANDAELLRLRADILEDQVRLLKRELRGIKRFLKRKFK
jgi:hypothetical protein